VTAEVAIMNEHAIVFASDSATTVTMTVNGKVQVRYFKGANKLFQLSRTLPVGLMIYESASILGVPWEILIKDFRAKVGHESSKRLPGYADRFFKFVGEHSMLFPDELRAEAFVQYAYRAVEMFWTWIIQTDEFKTAPDDNARRAIVEREVSNGTTANAAAAPQAPVTREDIDAATTKYGPAVVTKLAELLSEAVVPPPFFGELAKFCISEMMLNYKDFLPYTGIVIGGFGDDDYFPSFEVFDCYGFLGDRLITVRQDTSRSVARGGAVIEPFATTSMINTFRMGIGPDVFTLVRRATERTLTETVTKALAQFAPGTDPAGAKDLIEQALQEHQDEWAGNAMNQHYNPLARVVASLPIADMAALAKSLVELQSLKERVTRDSESVSGPIDVAAIGKHDGFIWIERKHYFKQELNPRYYSKIALEGSR
jgi:hypothetical protein